MNAVWEEMRGTRTHGMSLAAEDLGVNTSAVTY